jgi:hypothetical protein
MTTNAPTSDGVASSLFPWLNTPAGFVLSLRRFDPLRNFNQLPTESRSQRLGESKAITREARWA